jgi:hypothetical protein
MIVTLIQARERNKHMSRNSSQHEGQRKRFFQVQMSDRNVKAMRNNWAEYLQKAVSRMQLHGKLSRSYDVGHQPEPPDDILLVGFAVQLDVGHAMKHNQIKHCRSSAGNCKPAPRTASTTQRQQTRNEETSQQGPLVMQAQNEMVQPFQQAAIDGVIGSELERAVLLSQHVPG